MIRKPSPRSLSFLATLPASRRAKRAALATILISLVGFLVAVPFSRTPLPVIVAVLPSYEAALILSDLITAALLFGQYAIIRSKALLVLANGYLYSAIIAAVHLATYPNIFSPEGLLGATSQTTAWIYMFWHGGFPLFVVGYAFYRRRESFSVSSLGGATTAFVASILGVSVVVAGLTVLATWGHGLLPAIMAQDNHYTPALPIVTSVVWITIAASLLIQWRATPTPSVLDLWLMVTLCASFFDVGLSALFNAQRYDLGFYAGRIYGLIAAVLVLLVLLVENISLYLRLVRAHERERNRSSELFELNRELDAFSFSIAHELRGPLHILDTLGEALNDGYGNPLGADGLSLVKGIRSTSQRLIQMIDDLVVFARFGRQDLNRRRVDLTNLVNLVIREMRLDYDDSGLKISVSDLGYADVDASLVKQVFVNLLRNAVKFSRQRPDATIEVGRADVLGDGNWTYFVKDNGAGFAMKDAERLFGIFQRLHSGEEFEGTGVGLAIAQRIVHRHGGHIWAESAPQAGATFRFTLRPSEVLWRLVPMAVARAADGEPKEAGSGGEVHSIQEARSGSRP